MSNTNDEAIRLSIIESKVSEYLTKIEAARETYAPCSHYCIECETHHAEPTATCDASCDHFAWRWKLEQDAEQYLDGEAQDAWDRAGDMAYAVAVGK